MVNSLRVISKINKYNFDYIQEHKLTQRMIIKCVNQAEITDFCSFMLERDKVETFAWENYLRFLRPYKQGIFFALETASFKPIEELDEIDKNAMILAWEVRE